MGDHAADPSEMNDWLFAPQDLDLCRSRANRVARKYLAEAAAKQEAAGGSEEGSNKANTNSNTPSNGNPPVECRV